MTEKRKRRPKRPAMVEPIDGDFEDVIQSLFKAPPKKPSEWKYLNGHEQPRRTKAEEL